MQAHAHCNMQELSLSFNTPHCSSCVLHVALGIGLPDFVPHPCNIINDVSHTISNVRVEHAFLVMKTCGLIRETD